jgi:hypothetical protein
MILSPAKIFIIAAAAMVALTVSTARGAEEFSFQVTNKTDTAIKKILVSKDKKEWGYFKIGKGIAAHKTVTLAWDKSTNNESCEQWVKAVYEGGEESEPAKFDFCEADLEIEFE